MTERTEIERLLQMTGRTLEGLPSSYSMQEVESRFSGIVGGWTLGDCLLHQSDVIELLIGALRDALDKQPRWISVEERLPETDEWVAVWYRDKDGYCYFTAGRFEWDAAGRRYWMTDVDDNARAYPPEEITHWMPLPKPEEE